MWESLKMIATTDVKGVGGQRQLLLKQLGIESVHDLLFYFPRAYKVRSDPVAIRSISTGRHTIAGTISEKKFSAPFGNLRKRYLHLTITDGSGVAVLTAFKKRALFLNSSFKRGDRVLVEAHFSVENNQLISSRFEIEKPSDRLDPVLPIYPLKPKTVGQRFLRSIVRAALDLYPLTPEPCAPNLLQKAGLEPASTALRAIHFPQTVGQGESARKTFAFMKLLDWKQSAQAARAKRKKYRVTPAILPASIPDLPFIAGLPYQLTPDQFGFLNQVTRDLRQTFPFDRLLQGEVGTGKTIAAAAALVMAINGGGQAAFIVPTEILAEQIYFAYGPLFENSAGLAPGPGTRPCRAARLTTGLLCGSMAEADKKIVRERIRTGDLRVVIGTHSLLSEKIDWHDLRMLIIDEEHRFGVNHKIKLLLGEHPRPHCLIMTATPIPRSCAMVLYGGMDISFLAQLPFGNRTVETVLLKRSRKQKLYEGIRREIRNRRSVFYICPYINESEERADLAPGAAGIASVTLKSNELAKAGFRTGCLHSRLEPEEKREVMRKFKSGELDILVSTTVIEVGVDIHRAGLIVIENPERFGMAQLHQLRGRVGRDGRKGYCVLLHDDTLAAASVKRLRAFSREESGYGVSLTDLKNRGPGDGDGIRQTGFHWMYPFEPEKDNDLVEIIDSFSDDQIENIGVGSLTPDA